MSDSFGQNKIGFVHSGCKFPHIYKVRVTVDQRVSYKYSDHVRVWSNFVFIKPLSTFHNTNVIVNQF